MKLVEQVALLCGLGAMSLLAGCRQDMHDQPKFFPQRGTSFYADGRSVRPQVENTVARNQLHEDSYFYTGMVNGKDGDGLPFAVTPELLARGQERYNVYCTPCHSRVGNGGGMIVQRGYSPAGNFQGTKLRTIGLGHFFNVMTSGYGSMPDYAAQLTPVDRWAVAAYIRALQLSQNAQRSDVPVGVEVKPLASIVKSEGLPDNFAEDWDVVAPPDMPGASVPGTGAAPATKPTPPGATAPGPQSSVVSPGGVVPKETRVADAKEGHAVYMKNCVVCHTAELTGHPPTFPSLVGVVQRLGAAHVRHQVQVGQPPMPAFPQIAPQELDDLVAFLTNPAKAGVATAAADGAASR